MRRRLLGPAQWLGLLLLLSAASGCGIIDYYFLPPPEDTAQELYESGVTAMQEKDYDDAVEYFTKLKDRFPFSPYAPRAEIGLGDAYYMDERYPEAVEAYKEFEALHPADEEIPYVLFQIGMSSFRQFKSIDRRQDNIREGLDYFYRLEENYPGSKYAGAAKEYIVKSRRVLAEHEVYIADFFWRSERYGSAWKRYVYVVENFPDLPNIQAYAKRRAQNSYYEYQKELSQEEREQIEGSWKEWFEWL